VKLTAKTESKFGQQGYMMTKKTHMAAGILTGIIFSAINNFEFDKTVTCCVISSVAALLPDIDILTSRPGKVLKLVSLVINKIFGHRTICHAPLMYVFIYHIIRLNQFFCIYAAYIDVAYTGIFSHIFLDMLNPAGIPIFYPFSKKRFHLASIKTGGVLETIAHWMLLCCIIYVGYCMVKGLSVFPDQNMQYYSLLTKAETLIQYLYSKLFII